MTNSVLSALDSSGVETAITAAGLSLGAVSGVEAAVVWIAAIAARVLFNLFARKKTCGE